MKESPIKQKNKFTTGVRFIAVPDLVTTCPKCGGEIGLWSTEPETVCIFCEYKVFDKEGTLH